MGTIDGDCAFEWLAGTTREREVGEMAWRWNDQSLRGWAMLPLRAVVGFGFVEHGAAKWSRGPAGFGRLLEVIGVPLPHLTAWAVTGVELLAGAAILLGIFVALASLPLIASMVVAMLTIHVHFGFSSVNTIGLTPSGPIFGPPGYEINLLYITALIALAVVGPGAISLDGWLRRRRWRNSDAALYASDR